MPEYSRGIFFLFALLPFLLRIPFTNDYYQLDAKSCVQIIKIEVKTAKTMVAHKSKLLKLHYFLPTLKSLVRVHFSNTSNAIAHAFDNEAYLYGPEIW